VHSNSQVGKKLYETHTDLIGDTDLAFTGELNFSGIDVLFLCVGHGDARKFLDANPVPDEVKIIDLSQDFRLKANAQQGSKKFVYGLPELNREQIRTAQNIANPGCFATCIQLGLLPLAKAGLLTSPVNISATTGSTGAGQSLSATSHFTWRNNNLSVYKAFTHQHLGEIGESLQQLQPGIFGGEKGITFIPQRGDFTRGILAAIWLDFSGTIDEAYTLFEDYYRKHPFTHVSRKNIDLKQVVNTNKGLIYLEKNESQLLVISEIDNLLKGASGQAVQNMNLLFGFDETAGLKLKASAF
ncbi:MAG: N-acetyl-gamma-glutamyl-phosphate reductase, partial [Mucilaginibacter polytrichastri]|nr:N-acetyl-gamma-glutamyl-phosphate reductase [Mucilaginibacter polytrichastri]